MRETGFKKLSDLTPGLLDTSSVDELLGKIERLKESARVVQDDRCPACADTRWIEVDGGVRRCPKCRPQVKRQLAATAPASPQGNASPEQAELHRLLIELDDKESEG